MKMLDPSCESGAQRNGSVGTGFTCGTGCPVPGLGPHRYCSPGPRKNTVKELLMLKRQKNSRVLDENSSPLELQAELSYRPPAPTTLFQWQIRQEELRVAGTPGELLSRQDDDGDTVLHIAVAQGKRALAYVLALKMAAGGVLDLKEHKGQTALQIAAATNNHLIVRDLLTHGSKINTRDLWGRSPLHVCAQKGHTLSLQAIWRTLQRTQQPLDMEMYNYDGFTALHVAATSHNAIVKELRDTGNLCPYRIAELEERRAAFAATVKTLLLMGASVGTKDLKSGRTCLHVAAEEANDKLLRLLLNNSSAAAAINATAFNGNTALHVVCALQHSSGRAAATLLLARGADPGVRNLENELPWQLAPEGPSGEQVRQLLRGRRFQR